MSGPDDSRAVVPEHSGTATGPCLDAFTGTCLNAVAGPCLGGMTAVRQALDAAGVTDAEWVQMTSDTQDSDIADYLTRVQERARSETTARILSVSHLSSKVS